MRQTLPPGPRLPPPAQVLAWFARPTAFLERCRARYGNRFTLRLVGLLPMVMLADPDEVREVFTAPPDALHPGEASAKILEPILGPNSVILLDEDAHLEQRRLMLPAFHGEKMRALEPLMAEIAEDEVSRWPLGEPIALLPWVHKLSLEIMLRTVFGLAPGQRLERLRDMVTEMLSANAFVSGALKRDVGPIKIWSRFVAAREGAGALIFELIAERRRLRSEHEDVLSMLLEARHEDGSPMSDHELRDELMTLLLAGYDTTGGQLAWIFERLMRDQAIVDRLVEEIDAGGDEYLTATINETLRRRPVLTEPIAREVKRPFTVGDHTYPPGILLMPSIHLIHHDPAVYPDPYAFRPERFLGEQPPAKSWIPFGFGRRRCLGASFALVEMKIALRVVLSRLRLQGAGGLDVPVRRELTVVPRRGAMAVLSPRVSTPAAQPQRSAA
jgi:cytochrome P450